MASGQSSQDMWHCLGRQPQTLGNAQPRHRSESRRLSDRRRPVKAAAHKRDHCAGALPEGDPVRVFSRSADKWVDGEVVKFAEGNFVRVEYEIGEDWCGKTLPLHSDHLFIPSECDAGMPCMGLNVSSEDEIDPGNFDVRLRPSPVCLNMEQVYTKGAELQYRRPCGEWTKATVVEVNNEGGEVYYKLRYEAYDQSFELREVTVGHAEICKVQHGDTTCDAQAQSLRVTGTPRCLTQDGAQFQDGELVWYKRQNGAAVSAIITRVDRSGMPIRVDLKYVGLDHGEPWVMRKSIGLRQLMLMQHPLNAKPDISESRCSTSVRGSTTSQHPVHVDHSVGLGQAMLHAACRGGDMQLVESLLRLKADPAKHDKKTGSTPFHYATWEGHLAIVKHLLQIIPIGTDLDDPGWGNSINGETPLRMARERLEFNPSCENRLQVFALLFGDAPTAQEKAAKVHGEPNTRDIQTFRQNYAVAVSNCPFIGDRKQAFEFNQPNIVQKMVEGIIHEETQLTAGNDRYHSDWSYWRASFCRGLRRFGASKNLKQRMCAQAMADLLHKADKEDPNEWCNALRLTNMEGLAKLADNRKDVLRCVAIHLYTTAGFLFKAVNYAMRSPAAAKSMKHLMPYAQLLNDATRHFAKAKPWTGPAHRVLPIADKEMEARYLEFGKAYTNDIRGRAFCWTGFISATAYLSTPASDSEAGVRLHGLKNEELNGKEGRRLEWNGSSERWGVKLTSGRDVSVMPENLHSLKNYIPGQLFKDLAKYGARKRCMVFLIEPSRDGSYPSDLGVMAAFGTEDRELLYPAGQKFIVTKVVGNRSRKQLAEEVNIGFDPLKHDGLDVVVIHIRADDRVTQYAFDSFQDGGRAEDGLLAAVQRLREAETASAGKETELVAAACHQVGRVQLECDNKQEAVKHIQRAVNICSKCGMEDAFLGMFTLDLATAYLGSAKCDLEGGDKWDFDLRKAEEYSEQAIKIYQAFLQSDCFELMLKEKHELLLARANNTMGDVFVEREQFDEATKRIKYALTIMEKYRPDDLEVAQCALSLGKSYFWEMIRSKPRHTDYGEEALACCKRALRIQTQHRDGEHPEMAECHLIIGMIVQHCTGFDRSYTYEQDVERMRLAVHHFQLAHAIFTSTMPAQVPNCSQFLEGARDELRKIEKQIC